MDIEDLLRSLNAHSVEFVIIGATAFPIHGYARREDETLKGKREGIYEKEET
jgi:hypothetical protein